VAQFPERDQSGPIFKIRTRLVNIELYYKKREFGSCAAQFNAESAIKLPGLVVGNMLNMPFKA